MREIKFRGCLKSEAKTLPVSWINSSDAGVYDVGLSTCGDLNCATCTRFYSLEDVEIMQYTGVKDDVEKEIYEGDIIEIYNVGAVGKPEHYIGAVEYENGSFIYDRADKSKSIPLHEVVGAAFSVEVIGNVHENENILKSVRCCDCCGNNMYDGYYHEDSGDVVCDRECGNKHFEDFEERNEALEIIWTSFEY